MTVKILSILLSSLVIDTSELLLGFASTITPLSSSSSYVTYTTFSRLTVIIILVAMFLP